MKITLNTANRLHSQRSTQNAGLTHIFGSHTLAPRILALTCAALCSVPAAHATVVTLTADASVNTAHATTNYGTLANLFVGNLMKV